MAKYTEKKKAANRKWDSQNLERTSVTFSVGTLERIAAAAEKSGQSKNAFCRYAILTALQAAEAQTQARTDTD